MTTWFPEGYPTQPRVFYPPGNPPLSAATSNPNPPPWRGWQPRQGGTTSSSRAHVSGRPEQAPRGAHPHPSYPQPDLTDGVDYFKIGTFVRVRRWSRATDSFTPWTKGEIVRPILVDNEDGTQRRSYVIATVNPRTNERKEREFSPHFREITSLEADPVSTTPALRISEKSNIVFAPIPANDPSGVKTLVYSPALVLTSPDAQGRVRLRILAGHAVKREIDNFSMMHASPYTAATAQALRQRGFCVEGDGINRSF